MKSRNRNVEFFLLFFVAILVVCGYVLASLGRSSSIPANIIPFLVGILVLLLLAHLAVRKFAPRADLSLLPLAVAPLRKSCGRLAILDGRLRYRRWGEEFLRRLEPWTPLNRLLPD